MMALKLDDYEVTAGKYQGRQVSYGMMVILERLGYLPIMPDARVTLVSGRHSDSDIVIHIDYSQTISRLCNEEFYLCHVVIDDELKHKFAMCQDFALDIGSVDGYVSVYIEGDDNE